MTVAESINTAISNGDLKGIRIMMKDSLLVDPTFNEFKEMNRLAQSVCELYEEHDGREINDDESAWNDDYMNKLMVQVVGNFSHERVDHLKEVVRYLRPIAAHQEQTFQETRSETRKTSSNDEAQPGSRRYQEKEWQEQPYRRTTSNRGLKITGGAVAGGMVGGTIAGIAGGSILVGALLGAGVLGAVVAIATKEG